MTILAKQTAIKLWNTSQLLQVSVEQSNSGNWFCLLQQCTQRIDMFWTLIYYKFIPITIMHKAFQDICSISKEFCKNAVVMNVNHSLLVVLTSSRKHVYHSTWKNKPSTLCIGQIKMYSWPMSKELKLPTQICWNTILQTVHVCFL